MPEFVVVVVVRKQEVALLAIAEMGTAPPIIHDRYDMLCASDSIHSPPYIQDNYPQIRSITRL